LCSAPAATLIIILSPAAGYGSVIYQQASTGVGRGLQPRCSSPLAVDGYKAALTPLAHTFRISIAWSVGYFSDTVPAHYCRLKKPAMPCLQ
jgi:hypothetical protein